MREIEASEARDTLETLLDMVEHGEEVVITRRGKPVARLIREPGRQDRAAALAAAERIVANRKGRTLGGLKVKDPIDEGPCVSLNAVGRSAVSGRHLFVVFTLRRRAGEVLIRPISARFMHAKEVANYERQTKAP